MRKILFTLCLLLICLSCNRQDEPVPIHSEPVFSLRGTLDGEILEMDAGLRGVEMKTSELLDENNEHWYVGSFENNGNDPYSLSFAFRDIRGVSDQPIDPVTSLQASNYHSASLDTNSFFSVEFFPESFPSQRVLVGTLWDFGDGTTSTEIQPTHNYPFEDKSYEVCVTYTFKTGCERKICYEINPFLAGMVDIDFNTTIPGVVLGVAITKGFIPVEFRWDFENGVSEQGPEIAYFPTAGDRVERICLTAFDEDGNEYNICRDVAIDSLNVCVANFNFADRKLKEISHGEIGERVAGVSLTMDGEEWRTLGSGSEIRILDSEIYDRNSQGLPTRKLLILGQLDLFNPQGEKRSLIISEATIAVAYPD